MKSIPHMLVESPQSLMAQGSNFPLRKPPGFHYDFFLLGITTFIAGLIGVPAPNGICSFGALIIYQQGMHTGLIPQAPIHTQSLIVLGQRQKDEEKGGTGGEVTPVGNVQSGSLTPVERFEPARREVAVAVVEQRVSNLAQGAMCLVLLTGPFLHILGLIPRGACVNASRWRPFNTRIPPNPSQVFSAAFCEWIF